MKRLPEDTPESAVVDHESSERLAKLFGAFADPTRLRLMSALLNRERCVHELCDDLGVEQSAASHQLRILRNLDLVRRRKEGRHAYYRLDDSHVRDLLLFGLEHIQHGGQLSKPLGRSR